MSTFSDVLNRIFSSKLVVKRMPSGRLRTLDFDKLQALGDKSLGKYNGAKSSMSSNSNIYNNSGYGSYTDTARIEANRQQLYADYESMDSDAHLSAALDIYADESTVNNEQGVMLSISTDDDKIKAVLHNLYYDILNVDFNLWHWIRTLCKFGDLFLYLPTISSVGVVDAIPIHPSLIKRDDEGGNEGSDTEYIYEGDNFGGIDKNKFKYHEIAHFRVLTDTMYLPYGKSMLEGARKVWKQLVMMEDAMLIHRIMRAPERRIFKLDVGNLPDNAVDQHIDAVAAQMKKVPYIDPDTGDYNLKFNLMNMLEDFFLPTRGGDSQTDITTLEGLSNDGTMDDIEYLKSKLLAFLKIPKAYLGYDEGVDGKGTLAAEDIKFARFIERLQKIVVSELEKIGLIHLYSQGFKQEDISNFKLSLATPSLIYERQKVDLWNEKVNLVQNMKEQNLFSNKYMYENIFNLTPEQWARERELIVTDKQYEFRLEQISSEGNDPKVSGEVIGTPASIVQMQMASKMDPTIPTTPASPLKMDRRHDNEGRPPEHGSWERAKDGALGEDPTGRKEMTQNLSAGVESSAILKSMENQIVKLHEDQNQINVSGDNEV